MISLKLESTTDSLDLGALLNGTEGVQAIKGLTGAGLPPVSVQWSEGAGDGSKYRGKRVLARDIDIPLFISSETRAGLRAIVKKLAMILADEATLRLLDTDGQVWTLKVVRTGGGDFIYGVDTDGERELPLVITLRAGQPFWTAETATEVVKSDFSTTTHAITNVGSVATPPVWEIRGPGKNLVITSPAGEVLQWNGTLANGDTILIDSEKGAVTMPTGTNRYAELAASPRFAKVAPGASAWTVTYPNADAGLSRTNLCTNPNALVNTAGWSALGCVLTKHATEGFTATVMDENVGQVSHSITGVTAGSVYSVGVLLPDLTQLTMFRIIMSWRNGGVVVSESYVDRSEVPSRPSMTALAPIGATSLEVSFYLFAPPVAVPFRQVTIEKKSTVGTYFDGNTTDTATNAYAWTGSAGNSTSTLTLTPNRSTSQVRCRLNARDWMVI